jgi:hypothetical protein
MPEVKIEKPSHAILLALARETTTRELAEIDRELAALGERVRVLSRARELSSARFDRAIDAVLTESGGVKPPRDAVIQFQPDEAGLPRSLRWEEPPPTAAGS